MYRSLFPRDLFAEIDRLQRDMQQALDPSPTIRGLGRGFPALNVGGTPQTLEIYAFAPGLDPDALEVTLDRGILTIAGKREPLQPGDEADVAVHINERFEGPFRRVIALSEDADPEALTATYRDGVLRITVQRRASSQPRRVAIQ
ncbi:Hsp20/alpha crystallin family protein [Variovorax sp. J22P240]|uniref:Hsp20/alpha crystallin family protein n=1 Tax=Variovorax sp. J22P240 TaxID=3053514 RepID=UPI0025765701|nr:Hsp20/alpha crystallin family protein [Variovorax sp. J22P240]MDM0003061.1 Hsp20/alpha crystallin family protein [Variovorax sp. J22P240]